ncbi:MAG: metalloprotease TldD [Nevskiales bacterium]
MNLDLAQQQLLTPGEISLGEIERVLQRLMSPGIDAADLYFQQRRREGWFLEDSLVKDGSFGLEQGVGVRAISGEKTGFAYSDEIRLPALSAAAGAARAIAQQGQSAQVRAWHKPEGHALYAALDPVHSLQAEGKVALLHRADKAARAADSRVSQVMVQLAATQDTVLVAASDGTLAGDVRPLVRLNISVIVEENGKREQASHGGGARVGYEFFSEDVVESYAREAVRLALVRLHADDAPAGEMTVVLGPGWPGVLLHEAVGHGLEGDFNRKGSSTYAGRMGERVAAAGVTIVDDGTLPGRRGSLNLDDEGTPTQRTVLIEDGVLKGYMQDKLNAHLMGVAPTGNGRRESFAHLTMPRMTNTYMLAGAHEPQEIIASVERGLYAVNFEGGQVDITSGNFVFSTSEAYLIEGGKVTRPVKGATLIGNGPAVLQRVSMIGNDLKLDSGVGVCGKDGQSVPVGVGQPTLKVDGLTVGGTQTG